MFRQVLVPTDGSALSVTAAKAAVKLAKSLGAKHLEAIAKVATAAAD